MRSHAQAVIIGGGVIGCSIAYHLTAMGWRDIVVIERGELAGGSTWHSAGLVGQLRSSINLTRIMMDSVALYARLEAETGVDPGWMQVGSLRLASEERMAELRRQAVAARGYGLSMELLSPQEAVDLFPVMTSDGLVGAAFLPTDGRVDPNGLTQALSAGARARGAEIVRQTQVLGVLAREHCVRAVETDRGTIQTEVVVNAAGMWAREIGEMAGVVVPVIPMEHQFIVTKPIPGVRRDFPTLRDPDRLVYFREEVGGLVAGGYEPDPAAWGLDGIPPDFTHRLLPPNWDRFEQLGRLAMTRVPALRDAEIVRLINGPEAFTPDGGFLLGEAPELRGYFVAAGFNAHGIAAAGGIGKVLAEWIVEGQPHLDVWRMDIRRFGRHYRSRRYALAKTTEAYARHYEIHYPSQESEAGRPLRLSPVHARVVALGAVLGEKGGWERPNWYATNEREADIEHEPRGWMRKFWSSAIGVEHRATREAAGLFDFTSFSKMEVAGRGALRLLQCITDNDLDRPVGTITYTSMLNVRGGIECDLTVTRLADERFQIITGAAFGTHDMAWIRRHLSDDGSVLLRDLTGTLACIGLWGPRAREILRQVTDSDVSNKAFPYMTAHEITVGQVPVTALRVTYVGELGWELYAPIEMGLGVWDALWEAGRPFGLRPVGYRAVDTLRLEKGYRYWSADITPETTPYEAGLGFAVKLQKGKFLGREALERQRREGVRRRLCCLILDDPNAVAAMDEPVYDEEGVVGLVTSGGYGYAVRRSIAYVYLPLDLAEPGTRLTVIVDAARVPARVVPEPLFDPRHERVRA